MTEFMARVLTGCNATSYAISSALCFWMIDRFGRRGLMISGSSLQFFAYIMVAISVALLANAPTQVRNCINILCRTIMADIRPSGVPWLSPSSSSTTRHSGVLGAWFRGSIRQKSTVCPCAPRVLRQLHPPTGSSALCVRNLLRRPSQASGTVFISVRTITRLLSVGFQLTRSRIVFACFNLIFIPTVYFLYPETANRTLEDLDEYFDRESGNSTIIKVGNKVAKQRERPVEVIEAERRRIEEVAPAKKLVAKEPAAIHVENIGPA